MRLAMIESGWLDLRVVGVMWWRELVRYRRDSSQIFGAISRTLLWLVILGYGLGATLKEIEGFGSIPNGLIQPLYFLSDAIFPLKGIMGGVGFLDIPQSLRDELYRHGIYTIGGGWVVELPTWLKLLVHANPVSYMLDLLRLVTLGFSQLPMAADVLVVLAFPPLAVIFAARAMTALRRT